MRPLRDIEALIRRAILSGEDDALADIVARDGVSTSARITLHRENVRAGLTAALKAVYPVVERLVGAEFFAHAAHAFIATNPPSNARLFEYGEAFATFLDGFAPARELIYLGDVARLEWAINHVLHAPDEPAFDTSSLAEIPAAATPSLTFRFRGTVSYVSSSYPIDAIWHANQPDAPTDATIDLGAGGVALEIARIDNKIRLRTLPPAVHGFRAALAGGATLDAATAAALALDAAFDLEAALRVFFSDGVMAAARLAAATSDD